MRAGAMDRFVTIERKAGGTDAWGAPTEGTWTTFARVWAEKSDRKGQEYVAARQRVAARAAVYRMRYVAGVTAQMRLVDAGEVYEIEAAVEIGRAEGLEIAAVAAAVE